MRRQFTKEFKQGILPELETKPPSEVCREHLLHPSTVSGWRSDYERNPRDAFQGHGRIWKPEAKIARLERMLGELYAENALSGRSAERMNQPRNGDASGPPPETFRKVLDPYVDEPVFLDRMLLLPGSTLILDDNILSVASYLEEHGDVLF